MCDFCSLGIYVIQQTTLLLHIAIILITTNQVSTHFHLRYSERV